MFIQHIFNTNSLFPARDDTDTVPRPIGREGERENFSRGNKPGTGAAGSRVRLQPRDAAKTVETGNIPFHLHYTI